MATVIFDFDSTLITCESLEEVLKTKGLPQKQLQQIKEITSLGMSGKISFLSSLEKRLSMALTSKQDFEEFGKQAVQFLTLGMKDLIKELQSQKIDVWIVSGAIREVLLPIGKKLEIPQQRMLGVDLLWSKEGNYAGIDPTRPINHSKWEGASQIASKWTSPKIAIGDGMTDFALYEHKLVDQFIAFTQNAYRQELIDKGVPECKTTAELRQLIKRMIYG